MIRTRTFKARPKQRSEPIECCTLRTKSCVSQLYMGESNRVIVLQSTSTDRLVCQYMMNEDSLDIFRLWSVYSSSVADDDDDESSRRVLFDGLAAGKMMFWNQQAPSNLGPAGLAQLYQVVWCGCWVWGHAGQESAGHSAGCNDLFLCLSKLPEDVQYKFHTIKMEVWTRSKYTSSSIQ